MPVAVISCGRSGTNMALEILSGHPFFVPSVPEENKRLCKDNIVYPLNYLTKCDTVYMNYEHLKITLHRNRAMKVIWTIRNPRDMAMSKIYRGQPKSEGGDCKVLSDDATLDGCIEDIEKMFNIYESVTRDFRKRVLLVKMEDMINDVVNATEKMCSFLEISYHHEMINFISRMRNQNKSSRYSSIDKNEIDKYKNWKTVYDGFFTKKNYDMESFFKRLNVYSKYFGYTEF
jgi:hypothetical protein